MKTLTIAILVALVFGIATPPVWCAAHVENGPLWGVMDVCHSHVPALNGLHEIPCATDTTFQHQPLLFVTACTPHLFLHILPVVTFEFENPPQQYDHSVS
jgi:hypothetical protein